MAATTCVVDQPTPAEQDCDRSGPTNDLGVAIRLRYRALAEAPGTSPWIDARGRLGLRRRRTDAVNLPDALSGEGPSPPAAPQAVPYA
jgi:hypothetical protein